jgi:hypothetical protein
MQQLIVPLAIAIIVPLTLRWLARGQPPQGRAGLLCYSRRARLFAGLFCLVPPLLFSTIAVLAAREGTGDRGTFIMLILFFPALALPLALEFFLVTITYDDEAIHVSSPWSRRRSLRWSEIGTARWRRTAKWFDLSDGRTTVHVSPLLTGLEAFGTACRERMPEAAMAADWETSSVLRLMEQGRAHELVWGNDSPSALLMKRPR